MCDTKSRCCKKPSELKGKPEDCTPEQIKKCHGDEKSHSCRGQHRPEGSRETKARS